MIGAGPAVTDATEGQPRNCQVQITRVMGYPAGADACFKVLLHGYLTAEEVGGQGGRGGT